MHFNVIYIAYYWNNNCTTQHTQLYSFYKSLDIFRGDSTVLGMSIYKVL